MKRNEGKVEKLFAPESTEHYPWMFLKMERKGVIVITKRQSDGENSPSLSAAVFDARKECF